jgi:hypothetical protein
MNEQTLISRITALEKEVTRLKDLEAIRALKCEHGLGSDDPERISERLLALVTEDVELDYGEEFGSFTGKDTLRELLKDTPFSWTMHYMLPMHLEVHPDGRSASGIWYLWEPAAVANADGSDEAMWLGAVYEDEYRKLDDGSWKIAKMKLSTKLLVPYSEGWSAARIKPLASQWAKGK